MSDFDIVQATLAAPKDLTGWIVGLVGGVFALLAYFKKFNKQITKDTGETTLYQLLVNENTRLSNILAKLSLDMERMQKQLYRERDGCHEQISDLRDKLEELERKLRRYENQPEPSIYMPPQ